MQTAVDCNGSSGNSNNTITGTTTTTLVESSNSDANAARSTATVIRAPIAVLEQPSVLRHRLQVSVGRTSALAPANFAQKHGTAHHLVDVAEYLGSNVERMSMTPSPSPHASPTKKCQQCSATPIAATSAIPATAMPTIDIDSSSSNKKHNSSSTASSSSCSSSSSSSASSVIAAPLLARNGNAFPAVGAAAANGSDCQYQEVRAIRGLPLPPRSASFAAFEERCLAVSGGNITEVPTTPLLQSSSSSNSLSPATTTTTTTASASPLSTASTTPLTTSPMKLPTMEAQLLHWQDMPHYLQFNPYVLKGYRPLQTFKGCLLSLFYWHNETINILTHAIPIVYILAIVPGLMPWESEYRFLSFCHLFGSVAPWCGSFIYHLFMNIEKGENVYYRLLKLDMVGIWVSQSFGALPLVTATTFCFTYKWKWFIIIAYSLLSLWGLYKALTASSPWQRRLCFALPFTMRSFLTFLRTMGLVGGNPIALSHVYLQDGVSILGGAIGAMRIPEKWFPGLVDFYLNSHNIMHVLVVVAVYSMHKATIKDFEWMSTTNCDALANATSDAIDKTLNVDVEL